ncbi:MAG: hypothetical protein AB8G05_21415 [Oligoflexales bacterium]
MFSFGWKRLFGLVCLVLLQISCSTTKLPEWYEHPELNALSGDTFESIQKIGTARLTALEEGSSSSENKGPLSSSSMLPVENPKLTKKYLRYLKKLKVKGPFSWYRQEIVETHLLPTAPFPTGKHINNSLIWAFVDNKPAYGFRPMAIRLEPTQVASEFHLAFKPDGKIIDILITPKMPLINNDRSPVSPEIKSSLIKLADKLPATIAEVRKPTDLTYNLAAGVPQTFPIYEGSLPSFASYSGYAIYHASLGVKSLIKQSKQQTKKNVEIKKFYSDVSDLTTCYLQINMESCIDKITRYLSPKVKLPAREQKLANEIYISLLTKYFYETSGKDLNLKKILGSINTAQAHLLASLQNDFQIFLLGILGRFDGPALIMEFSKTSKVFSMLSPHFLKYIELLTVCLLKDLNTLDKIATEDDLFFVVNFLKDQPRVFNAYVKALHDMGLAVFAEPMMAHYLLHFPAYSKDIYKIFDAGAKKRIANSFKQLKAGHLKKLKNTYGKSYGTMKKLTVLGGLNLEEERIFPPAKGNFKVLVFINNQSSYCMQLVKQLKMQVSTSFLEKIILVDVFEKGENFEAFVEETEIGESPLLKNMLRIDWGEETKSFYESMTLYQIPRILVLNKDNKIVQFNHELPFSFASLERDLLWVYGS